MISCFSIQCRAENLTEAYNEDVKELRVRLWWPFKDLNLDKHNNSSDSNGKDEEDQKDEYYWEKEISFGYKA